MRSNSTTSKSRSRKRNRIPEYGVWEAMRSRCLNPNMPFYKYYGGRGITICNEWLNSFDAFYRDVGPRPDGYTIERVNNDGNYEPNNVRWASRAEQGQNRREASDAVKITYNGETRTMAEWARHLDVPYQMLYHRWLRSPNEDFGLLCTRPPRTSGEYHFAAKFTAEQVREMRRLYFSGECSSYAEVGRRFNLDRRHAHAIITGKYYKDVV